MNNKVIPTKQLNIYPPTGSTSSGLMGIVTVPHAISYDFQVVEFVDSNNKVIKSRLEVQRNIHDDYGNIAHSEGWTEVPRIQRPI